MVTQITLKTEGPHGLPSGRQTEVDPLYRGLIISTVYDSGHASHPRGLSLCANATARERGGRWFTRLTSATPGQGLRIKPGGTRLVCFSVRVSLAGIEPVGFRVKSDLRNHQAIVQPRLYDSLMVTRITLASSHEQSVQVLSVVHTALGTAEDRDILCSPGP